MTLARKSEIDVRNVPLERLVDQFQLHAKERALDFDSKAGFAKETSWLHHLKSGLLLEEDEGASTGDEPPRSLEVLFQSFIDFREAQHVKNELEKRQKELLGIAKRPKIALPQKMRKTKCHVLPSALVHIYHKALERSKKQSFWLENSHAVDEERAYLLETVTTMTPWRTLFKNSSPFTLISRFIALLSLIKEGYFRLDDEQLSPNS